MLNTKTMSVLKRISKQAPETRPVLKNYKIDDGMLYMTDGHRMVWTPTVIKDGLYTIEGENVTETAGNYPDVVRLIPTDNKTAIKVNDVKTLLEFVKAFVKLHGIKRSDKNPDNILILNLSGNIVKITGRLQCGVVNMSYYNPFYLIDVLEFISANIDDNTATIKYNGSNRPLVIETTNGTGALLMPVRK